MQILVDDREGPSGLAARLAERWDDVRVARLLTGDIQVGARVLVERKTAADFLASLRDARIFRQLASLGQAARGKSHRRPEIGPEIASQGGRSRRCPSASSMQADAARRFLARLKPEGFYHGLQAAEQPILLCEGDPFALVEPRHLGAVRGAWLSILSRYGIPILEHLA